MDDGICTKISYITEERLSRTLRILPSLVYLCRCVYYMAYTRGFFGGEGGGGV